MLQHDCQFNTPCTFTVYMMDLILAETQRLGGLEVMEHMAEEKSQLLYDTIDGSSGVLFSPANPKLRSHVTVPFGIGKRNALHAENAALEQNFWRCRTGRGCCTCRIIAQRVACGHVCTMQ